MSWNDVPSDHQNGIITGYKVYIKKAIGNNPLTSYEVTGKSFTKSGLDLWTLYDVKVSAKTSVGEGTISNTTRVRTDEDSKWINFSRLIMIILREIYVYFIKFFSKRNIYIISILKQIFIISMQVSLLT